MQPNRRRLTNELNDLLAYVALLCCDEEWIGAVQLADSMGYRYRPLAFALRRLVQRGVVEETVVPVRGKARATETQRRYRVAAPVSQPQDVFDVISGWALRATRPAGSLSGVRRRVQRS